MDLKLDATKSRPSATFPSFGWLPSLCDYFYLSVQSLQQICTVTNKRSFFESPSDSSRENGQAEPTSTRKLDLTASWSTGFPVLLRTGQVTFRSRRRQSKRGSLEGPEDKDPGTNVTGLGAQPGSILQQHHLQSMK